MNIHKARQQVISRQVNDLLFVGCLQVIAGLRNDIPCKTDFHPLQELLSVKYVPVFQQHIDHSVLFQSTPRSSTAGISGRSISAHFLI